MPALLGDQEFGNVYTFALQGRMGTPGAVPDHVDRRVLYDLLAGRIAPDPDFIGVSFYPSMKRQSRSFTVPTMKPRLPTAGSWNSDLPF